VCVSDFGPGIIWWDCKLLIVISSLKLLRLKELSAVPVR
jgi:hypothetical protein